MTVYASSIVTMQRGARTPHKLALTVEPDLEFPDKSPSLPRLEWQVALPSQQTDLLHTPAWARSTQEALFRCSVGPTLECSYKFSNPGGCPPLCSRARMVPSML
jgi:hypothetical protein